MIFFLRSEMSRFILNQTIATCCRITVKEDKNYSNDLQNKILKKIIQNSINLYKNHKNFLTLESMDKIIRDYTIINQFLLNLESEN